jgi:hypothetical protein
VGVGIDQTGKHGRAAQIDHLRAVRNLHAAANRSNSIAVNKDHGVGNRIGTFAVQELAAPNGELFGRGSGLSLTSPSPGVLKIDRTNLNQNADREKNE